MQPLQQFREAYIPKVRPSGRRGEQGVATFTDPLEEHKISGEDVPAPAASPADGIEDVLGRFDAWKKARNAGRKKYEMVDGVREVSYDEALESSHRRRQAHNVTPPASANNERSLPKSLIEEGALAPDKITLSSAAKPTESADDDEPLPPSFRTVLRETVSPDISSGPLALVWPATPKAERQVSMSFRVAASEHALIKARAAEAGLSVSAYLRQCALEVEKLRAQVHHTLALFEQGQNPTRSLAAGSPHAPLPAQGWVDRLRQRIFGTPSGVAVRA
jgi:hypothetical protein